MVAKEVSGHAALIEKLKISPYRVGLQWVVESMLMGRYAIGCLPVVTSCCNFVNVIMCCKF